MGPTLKDNIRTWHEGEHLVIQLARPEKANAYNQTMLDEIERSISYFETTSKAKVLIVTGEGGKAFCAGADLSEIKDKRYDFALDLKSAKVFNHLSKLHTVTIAAINGAAFGGGLELALSCDLRICTPRSSFSFPELDHDVIPAAGGTHKLPVLIGKAKAKELILGGAVWNAEQALSNGLVSQIVEDDELMSYSSEMARRISKKNPLAVRLAKQIIDNSSTPAQDGMMESISQALLYELKRKL